MAPRSEQGGHVQRPKPLIEGVLVGQRLEFADERSVPTEPEVGIDSITERSNPQTLEAGHLGNQGQLIAEFSVRPAAPQAERLGQHLGCALGIFVDDGKRSIVQRREHVGVQLSLDVE